MEEKAYLAHQAAVDSVNKPAYSGGRGGKFQTKAKSAPRGKGKGKGTQNKTKEGGFLNPRKGAATGVVAPIFLRACPKPVVEQ